MYNILLSVGSFVSGLWDKSWSVIVAILFFGVVIFVHEVGHFSFAKLFKVKVNEFSMGMGPRLVSFGKKETKYSLKLLPFGGSVMMEGEDEDSADDRAFFKKPVWQRFIIIAAGATINLILGVVIVAIMLSQMNLIGTRYIHSFHKNAISEKSGLMAGDEIIGINGKRVVSSSDLTFLMMRDKDGIIDFKVVRDGEKINVNGVKFNSEKIEGTNMIDVEIDFIRVGVKPSVKAVGNYAFRESVSIARMVWLSLFDLITGQYGLNDLSGPVGVVEYVSEAAKVSQQERDLTPVFNLMAMITINVGVFNLLPIPALDGGRLLFMFIEMIFRKPIPRKYEGYIHAAGLILLLGFVFLISINDIIKLFR